jgi:hypothetical protein
MFSGDAEKRLAVGRIRRRLAQLPNNGHLEVWLQRISYPFDSQIAYREGLCRLVGGKTATLWNNSWIVDASLSALVDPGGVVNRRRLKHLRPIIPRREFAVFEY